MLLFKIEIIAFANYLLEIACSTKLAIDVEKIKINIRLQLVNSVNLILIE